jgi:membrane-associated protease RseP (regulator of RpoE activity)
MKAKQSTPFILAVTFLFSSFAVKMWGQDQVTDPVQPQSGYTMLSEKGIAKIPFELVNNHICIPVKVNGSEALRMILDTGMPADGAFLFGGPRIDELGLQYVGEAMVSGVGGDPEYADVAMGVTLDLPDLKLMNQMVIVMPYDSTRNEFFQEDGAIGYALFSRFVVEIDYAKKVVKLTEPEKYTYKGSGQELSISFINNFPLLECSVEMESGKKVPVELTVDTGASHSISLNVGSHEAIKLPKKAIEFELGRGVGGVIEGHVGRIKSLHLGKYSLDNIVTSFYSGLLQGPMDIGENGSLGSTLLHRFIVTFDYPKKRMILEPNKCFDDPFEFNMAGMAFTKTGKGQFRIERVVPDSPASESGLKVGDLITLINGQPAQQLKIDDFYLLLKNEGKEVSLEISRNGKKLEVKMKLRRLI